MSGYIYKNEKCYYYGEVLLLDPCVFAASIPNCKHSKQNGPIDSQFSRTTDVGLSDGFFRDEICRTLETKVDAKMVVVM